MASDGYNAGFMTLAQIRFYSAIVVPGAVLMALEIVSSRVLAPEFGNSVYVWGSIIGVFLAAMSVGYWWGGRLADRWPSLATLGRLILGAAVAQLPILLAGRGIVAYVGDLTGGSPGGTLLASAILFGPGTVLLATVAPYAVKIATRDLDLLGGTAGHLYAISTAASLVGTLGATFVLIPHLALETILRLLMALTTATSVVAVSDEWRQQRLTLGLAATLLVVAVLPVTLGERAGVGILADRMTPYQTLRVVESKGVRLIYSDGAVHAAVEVESGDPYLNYPRYVTAGLLIEPEIDSFLCLGMGGGNVGTYFQSRVPELQVEYVEIDPAVPELARRFMFFEDGDRSTVHVDDGRRFLTNHPERRWDYVYVDTYIGYSVPFHLATAEFFRQAKGHLEPGGVLGVNIAGNLDDPFARAILRTLGSVYRHTYIFAVLGGNHLFLATDRTDAPTPEEMRATAERLDREHDFDPRLAEIAERLRRPDLDLGDAVLLTDGYAPVNHLIRFDQDPESWRARRGLPTEPAEP